MKNTETFKTKSKESLEAAEALIKKKYFNSSVHCAYYACVQLLNYILRHNLKMSDAIIEDGIKNFDGGSHEWLQSFFYNHFFSVVKSYEQATDFQDNYADFKASRMQADYKYKQFTEKEANELLGKIKLFIDNLKTHFKI